MLHTPLLPIRTLALAAIATIALLSQSPTLADTTGHWRFDDAEAVAGGFLTATTNTTTPGTLDATPVGSPLYSDDVISAEIYDPVADAILANTFSLDATAPNSRLEVPDDAALNTSFTVEAFIKLPPAQTRNIYRIRLGDLE